MSFDWLILLINLVFLLLLKCLRNLFLYFICLWDILRRYFGSVQFKFLFIQRHSLGLIFLNWCLWRHNDSLIIRNIFVRTLWIFVNLIIFIIITRNSSMSISYSLRNITLLRDGNFLWINICIILLLTWIIDLITWIVIGLILIAIEMMLRRGINDSMSSILILIRRLHYK